MTETTLAPKAVRPDIMRFFAYAHLPERLQAISRPFSELAETMLATTNSGAEQSAGLRKLLEAKDCMVRAALVLLLAVAGVGCSLVGDIVTTPTQTVVIDQGQGPQASASPSASGSLPPGSWVRVGVFGYSCGSATNSEAQVPVGCEAYVTATPKAADGSDLSLAVHGTEITWSIVGQGATVDCQPGPETTFNRTCRGLAPGAASLTATVKGVAGTLSLAVIP